MSKAIVKLVEMTKFRFDERYTCPYRDDQLQKRTIKELADSATEGCPVCFIHHYIVNQGIPDITLGDQVYREHTNPFADLAVETPDARIQWRDITFFIQASSILRKSIICSYFCLFATGPYFYAPLAIE